MVKDFNEKGETLSLKKHTRLLRCCKIIIDENINKIDSELKRKKLLLNDFDILSLKKGTRLYIFTCLKNIVYSYKKISEKLLLFKTDCDKYLPKHENIRAFNAINCELTSLLSTAFEQLFALSHKMFILTDKYNFSKRSCSFVDPILNKEYMNSRCQLDESIQDFLNELDISSDTSDTNEANKSDSAIEKDAPSYSDNNCDNNDKTDGKINNNVTDGNTDDKSSDTSSSSDKSDCKNVDDKNANGNEKGEVTSAADLEDISIIPKDLNMLFEKVVNDENSFDCYDNTK